MRFMEGGQRIVEYIKSKLLYVLVLVLLASGTYEIYRVATSDYSDDWLLLGATYSAVIKILMAEFIIFDPKKSVVRGIGFYAMSIGLSRLLNSIQTLSDVSTVSFAIGVVTLIMSVNILYSSYKYMNDTARGRNGMITSTSVLAVIQIAMLVILFQSERLGLGEADKGQVVPMTITLLQYLLLLMILDTKELRFSTLMEKINTRVESARVTNTLEYDKGLRRSDVVVLKHMFDDRSCWHNVDDGGPVECESRIRIVDGRTPSCMILQKWKDSERIHVTVTNDDSGSMILAKRFSVSRVVSDSEDDGLFTSLCLFDDRSLLAQISVRTDVEEEEEANR